MFRGERIGLRARIESDVAVLHSDLYDDVLTRSRADGRAWRPISPESPSAPYRIDDPPDNAAVFSVVELVEGEPLAGEAVLWGIDLHSRKAHFGVSLRPAFRGRGLGRDVLRTMCDYAFAIRGLHRVGLETLADNAAMIGVAEGLGFVREGLLRQAAWVNGEFLDEVVFGILEDEWKRRAGDERHRHDDEAADEAGMESFPASDPLAF
ncbi:MAG: GNAT family protein [Acidimicrobiales bacterium]|jgi:RimJ/RimL family protein N-acetyltransferase